jgi:hypothetical protein
MWTLMPISPRMQRWACRLMLAGGLLTGLAGCSHFWEDVTSRSNEPGVWANVKYRWDLVFNRPDPMQVLATSNDGDMRRRALATLETQGSFWNKQDPETILRLLSACAANEPDPINRALAVERLAELKDPRVPQLLIDVYQAPVNAEPRALPVRLAALRGMGQSKDPATIEVLTAAVQDRELHVDLRFAAADALGSHQNYHAANSLVKVLREERDVALKYRAHQSLQKMTGRKDIPARADSWEEAFRQAAATGQPLQREPSPLLKLVNWWSD